MKLNTKSRYAVMALADLAKFSYQNPVSLRDISLRQNISILYLEQIFLKLKKLKKTIIFATHNRELANRADYKLYISQGTIKRVNAR